MNSFLRQSTASQSRILGPFVDDTDGKTPETGLTIANTDIKLMSNGGGSANKNSGGGTHRVNGDYGVTFDATDSATVGELKVSVLVSGARLVTKTFWVLEEAIYDALFAASATAFGATERNAAADALIARTLGTESYAADGAVPTFGQMQFMIWSALSQFDISTITLTSRKLDGSSSAMTFTLNDATTPTSRTRAT